MKVISIWIVVPIKRPTPTREQSPVDKEQVTTPPPSAEEVGAVKEMLAKRAGNRTFPEHFGVSDLSRN